MTEMTEDSLAGELFTVAVNMLSQQRAAAVIATMLASLRTEFIKSGFTHEEAIQLCNTWVAAWVAQTASGKRKTQGECDPMWPDAE